MLSVITSKDNPLVKQAVRLRENADERRERGLFFLEGYRLCRDALASGFRPAAIFITKGARAKYDTLALERSAGQAFEVADYVAAKLRDTANPQGVFGLFAIPPPGEDFWKPGGRYIALERVQDPGNLGAVARTAEALGLDGLLVGGGSDALSNREAFGCDVYHPKSLRASMGSLLRLPVHIRDELAPALAEAAGRGYGVYAAVPDADALPITQIDLRGGAVVAIGNEGAGLSEAAVAACGKRVTIPMAGRAESLNAAAAAVIVMWEMGRGGA